MTVKKGQIEDSTGNVLHPETEASLVTIGNTDVESTLNILSSNSTAYAVTTGSANVYAITINPAPTIYKEGFSVCIKINVTNTEASTLNVNGLGAISILDGIGNKLTAESLKANIPYTLRYNGSNFILQGKGGGGNATSDKLLSGYKATVDSGQITGNMANLSSSTIQIANHGSAMKVSIDPTDNRMGIIETPNDLVSSGYIDKTTRIKTQLWGLLPSNIKAGENIGQYPGYGTGYMTGTFTSDANAQAGHILSGQTAYVNGNKITGNIPNRGEYQYAGGFGSGADYYAMNRIPWGYYPPSSNGWAPEIRFSKDIIRNTLGVSSDKIISGQQIAEVWGNIPNNGAINGNLNCGQSKIIPRGYTSGGTIVANSLASQTPSNADASKIVSGYYAWINGSNVAGTYDAHALSQFFPGDEYTIIDRYSSSNGIYSLTYFKTISITCGKVGGTVRVKYGAGYPVQTSTAMEVYSRLYVNNVPRGIEHKHSGGTQIVEDVFLNTGDEVSIWVKSNSPNSFYAAWCWYLGAFCGNRYGDIKFH